MRTSIHSGGTGITRHSPRDGVTDYTWSPRGPGFLAPVIPQAIAHRCPVRLRATAYETWHQRRGVRTTRLLRPQQRRSSRTPQPAHELLRPAIAPHAHDAVASTASHHQRSWRSRAAPLIGWDDEIKSQISENRKQCIFAGGTGQEFCKTARRANHLNRRHAKSAAAQALFISSCCGQRCTERPVRLSPSHSRQSRHTRRRRPHRPRTQARNRRDMWNRSMPRLAPAACKRRLRTCQSALYGLHLLQL